jgi:lysozyme family protein
MKLELRQEYQSLWDGMLVSNKAEDKSKFILDKILSNKNRYLFVSGITGVPWFMIATIHSLECSLNFNNHLHNGDPLTGKTYRVPAGRPLVGNPPYSWEASAVDALMMKISGGWPKEDFQRAKNNDMASVLYLLELYNGMGYRRYHPEVKTPYIWAGTNRYISGKYVEDGKFDPNAISGQIGAAVLLKKLVNSNIEQIIVVKNSPIQLDKISKEKAEFLQKLMNDIATESWGTNFEPLIVDGEIGKNTKEMFNNLFGTKIV